MDGKNFTGLGGDLFNKFSDIGWANLFFNYERSKFIDYSEPYIVDYGAFMVNCFRYSKNKVDFNI